MSGNPLSRSTLSRSPLVIALIVSIMVAVSSACAPSASAAVRVDGWEISRSRFVDELNQLANDEELMGILGLTAYSGSDENSYDTSFTAAIANLYVNNRLLVDEVERRGLEVDLDAARQILISQMTSMVNSKTGTDGAESGAVAATAMLDRVPWIADALVTRFAYSAALQQAFTSEIATEDALHDLYEKYKEQMPEQACVSHILLTVGTVDPMTGQVTPGTAEDDAAALAKANELKARIQGGADFAEVAKADSDDPSAAMGGSLGCNRQGAFVPEFDDAVWSAKVGDVVGPVKTVYGYHLIEVESRGTPTFEDVRDQLEQNLSTEAGQALTDWLVQAGRDARIEVDGRFGRWNAEQGVVMPPDGADPAPVPSLVDGGTESTVDVSAIDATGRDDSNS